MGDVDATDTAIQTTRCSQMLLVLHLDSHENPYNLTLNVFWVSLEQAKDARADSMRSH